MRLGLGSIQETLGTKRGFGSLLRICSIKREAGEGFGKCMSLDVTSGCWTGFKTKIRKKKVCRDLRLHLSQKPIFMWKSHRNNLYGVLQSHQSLVLSPLSYSFNLKLFFYESHNISEC